MLGMVIWIYLQPSYSKLLVWASQKAISWVENKEKTSIILEGNKVIYTPLRLDLRDKKSGMVGKRDIREVHYNSVILFALILFSSRLSLEKRIWVLITGHTLLFLTQVFTILVQAKFFYAIQLGEYSQMHYGQFSRNLFTFLKQFFELIGRFSFPLPSGSFLPIEKPQIM